MQKRQCLSGECLDGVCGSPTVSGSYLGVSSRCLGEYRCQINHKELNRSRQIKLLPFFPSDLPQPKRTKFWGVCEVSGGCLEGVWKVSAGCLGDSGYCLVYWLSKKIIFGHNTQILHYSSSDL